MEISNSRLVPALQERTWLALNDPNVLRDCIPGCEAIDKVSDSEYQIVMHAKIGPVSAKFRGKMALSDLDPPESYTVSFEGQGGAMGFGKGSAKVSLRPEPGGTMLSYSVKAQVGGKLAQIGSRLIDGAALKIADDFFERFIQVLTEQDVAAVSDERIADTAFTEKKGKRKNKTWLIYAIASAALVVGAVVLATA